MEKEGLGFYLYCLYRGGGGLPHLVGIDGDHKVFALSRGDVSAVLSLVPLEEFGSTGLERKMGDPEWVASHVLVHEGIIEEIMAVYPVMPMRFCTIFAARNKIDELLRVHHAKIICFLSDIADKEEWGVKGYIKGCRLREALNTLPPVLQADEGKLEQVSPGQGYLVRKKMALALKDRLHGRAMQIVEEVFQGLLAHAVKGVRNKTLQLEEDEKRGEMNLNAAFLVSKGGFRAFRDRFEETEEKYRSEGLSLSLTGPWPPYNFCPVFEEEMISK